MNGNDLIVYEERNCSRLQREFLEKHGIYEYEKDEETADNLLQGDEYWDFVLEDRDNRGNE